MSFIDTYMKKYRLGNVSKSTRKNLAKIEKRLNSITKSAKSGLPFLDAIKEHGEQIGDLIERVQQHFEGWKFTWANAFSSFQFVTVISTEVFQIINILYDEIVPDGLTGEEAWEAKKDFGRELVYFVWMTVDPLKNLFTWIPFKRTIEKSIVMWLAEIGLEAARKFFNANKEVSSFAAKKQLVIMKAL